MTQAPLSNEQEMQIKSFYDNWEINKTIDIPHAIMQLKTASSQYSVAQSQIIRPTVLPDKNNKYSVKTIRLHY